MYDDGYSIDPPRQGQGPRAQSLIDRARQTGGADDSPDCFVECSKYGKIFWGRVYILFW